MVMGAFSTGSTKSGPKNDRSASFGPMYEVVTMTANPMMGPIIHSEEWLRP